MKKTVFLGLTLTILSLAALPLSAQRGGMHGNGHMGMENSFMHFNMMQEKFDLSDSQVDKMYKIQKDYSGQIHKNRKDTAKVKDLHDKCREEMDKVLTTEQKAKRDSFSKDHMKNDKMPHKDKMPPKKNHKDAKKGGPDCREGHMGPMHNDLGLTDAQQEKIFKIDQDYMDKFYKNRKDENKIQELREKYHSEIQSVYTPEQKAKMEEFKKNGPKGDHKKGDHKKPDKKK